MTLFYKMYSYPTVSVPDSSGRGGGGVDGMGDAERPANGWRRGLEHHAQRGRVAPRGGGGGGGGVADHGLGADVALLIEGQVY